MKDGIGLSLASILLVGLLAAVGVIGWQIFAYLKFGAWHSLSVTHVMCLGNIEWGCYPSAWFGLHKILSELGLSAALLIVAVVALVTLVAVGDN